MVPEVESTRVLPVLPTVMALSQHVVETLAEAAQVALLHPAHQQAAVHRPVIRPLLALPPVVLRVALAALAEVVSVVAVRQAVASEEVLVVVAAPAEVAEALADVAD